MDINTLCELIYLRDTSNPKLQKILNHDDDKINYHMYNAGSMINENKTLNDNVKDKIQDYIMTKIKK